MRQGNHEDITIKVLDKDVGLPGKKPRGGIRIRWIDNRPIRIDMNTLVWLSRPNDGRQECVVKDGSNGRHTSEQDPG